jgi:hypothetical protein
VAAILEQRFRVRCLKIVNADFRAGNMRRNGEDGNCATMAIEESIDEVEVSGSAAARTDGQLTGDMRCGTGSEGRAFLVAHMNPFNVLQAAQGVGEAVERISDHAVDALYTCLLQ